MIRLTSHSVIIADRSVPKILSSDGYMKSRTVLFLFQYCVELSVIITSTGFLNKIGLFILISHVKTKKFPSIFNS
jgi:hypothetical protein